MLYAIDSGKIITTIPYPKDYKRWRTKLSDEDHQVIIATLSEKIGDSEIQTSSWMPGKDWTNTPFAPIYDACDSDYESAAMFFGLLVWEAFMHHSDSWGFGHYKLRDIPIAGLTYFKVTLK